MNVIPLYCGRRRIETIKFYLQEQPMNEVFNGRPAFSDMFNILISPPDSKEKHLIRRPMSICWCPPVADEWP